MIKKYNRVTYEELSDDLSHYEISCLASFKAVDIIQSGISLISNEPYKPKVAIVALNELCEDKDRTLLYKQEINDRLFNLTDQEVVDEYSIDLSDNDNNSTDNDIDNDIEEEEE